MAALACLMLVLTSAPVMASGMAMPMQTTAGAAANQASMRMPPQHMANDPMAACCQGQGGQAGMPVCHCPVLCGSMLPTVPAVGMERERVAVAYARLPGVQVPSPSPLSPLRPPNA
jgi:hypothetical protein